MGYSIRWEPPTGVYLELHGVVSDPEFVRAVQEVHADERYDGLRYVLDDLSGLETFDVAGEVVHDVFAASVGAGMTNPNRRIFVVATNQRVVQMLHMMTAKYSDALPIALYPDLASARLAIKRYLAAADPIRVPPM